MIWLAVLPLLAAVKVIIQGWISRQKCKTAGDSFFLNALIFGASAIVLFLLKFNGRFPVKVLLPAVFLGVCNTAFQCFYLAAFKTGPVGMTVVINNFNLVFPIVFGAFVFSETVTKWNLAGMAFMAVSLVLLPRGKSGKFNFKWLWLSLSAMVASGINSVLLLIISHSDYSKYESDMAVVSGFAVAAVLTLLISLVLRKSISIKLNALYCGGIAVCGVALGLFNCLTVVALKVLPAVVFCPVSSVLIMLLITLSDYLIYKEKMSLKQIIGFVVAAFSVVLMNISG